MIYAVWLCCGISVFRFFLFIWAECQAEMKTQCPIEMQTSTAVAAVKLSKTRKIKIDQFCPQFTVAG